jgi:hypoxanthine-guanine phosphoribosyltransferase
MLESFDVSFNLLWHLKYNIIFLCLKAVRHRNYIMQEDIVNTGLTLSSLLTGFD